MISILSPSCPLAGSTQSGPDCAKRLLLRECLKRCEQEAQRGVLDTGRYRCRHLVWGRGPTLVLIPGMASDALSFAMLLARLQEHFRLVSFDLPVREGDSA